MVDEQRKTHIFRVIGKSPGGTVKGTYLDLERSEYYTLEEGGGPNWQRRNVKLKWYEDDAGKVPNPSRKTTMVKVIPPGEDPESPQLWFEVDMVDAIVIRDDDQVINVHFDNSAENLGRKVAIRRIEHQDTTVDDRFPDGGVIPKREYQKVRGTKDEDQHLDIEIIKKRAFRDADQIYAIKYNNQALIDATALPDVNYGPGQVNPPWRFDPLQIPVNIKTKALDQQWLLAISNWSRHNGDNASLHADLRASDGEGFANALGGASGSGITVIAGAAAYGSITQRDGSKRNVFLACSTEMRVARLGTINNGGVSWQTVWSAEGNPFYNFITGISYANDRFFITFMAGEDGSRCNVISTKDGVAFSEKQAPFPSRGNTSGPYAGGVVYDETLDLYLMVGDDFQDDDTTEFGYAYSQGFCWATSKDGLTWAGRQINGQFQNPGGGGHFVGNVDATSLSTVAAGNGVFVGAASQRHEVMKTIIVSDGPGEFHEDQAPYIISSCAVAVSKNGTTWTTVPLPGAFWQQDEEEGDVGGTIVSVVFVEDESVRDKNGNTGYFIACGYEGAAAGFENAKLWKSIDGETWSLIRSDTWSVFADLRPQFVGLSVIDKKVPTVVRL